MKDEQTHSYTMLSVVIDYELRKQVKQALLDKGLSIRQGIPMILREWLKRNAK